MARVARGTAHGLAQGLGWFSLGLGLAELIAPRRIGRTFGLEEHSSLIQAYGVREIAAGIGILAARDPTPWVWARVAGDALDAATLTMGLNERNPRRPEAAMALLAVAGVTLLDVVCARALSDARAVPPPRPLPDYSDRSGLPRPPEEMRGAARDFEVPKDMRIPEPLRPYAVH